MSDTFENGQKVVAETKPITEVKPEAGGEEAIAEELKFRPYREFFNISEGDLDGNQKLDYILRWANPKGKLEKEEVLEKLSRLNTTLGAENLGEQRINKIYRHIRILRTIITAAEGEI
jgi:hypothetical protein